MEFEKKPEGVLFAAGRVFSFWLALGLIIAILYLLVFRHVFLGENILAVFGLVVAVALVNGVFPRVLERVVENSLSRGMKAGAMLAAEKISAAIGWVTLSITYFVGVGLVFVVSRIAGKRFMEIQRKGKQTYWIAKKGKSKDSEMF